MHGSVNMDGLKDALGNVCKRKDAEGRQRLFHPGNYFRMKANDSSRKFCVETLAQKYPIIKAFVISSPVKGAVNFSDIKNCISTCISGVWHQVSRC